MKAQYSMFVDAVASKQVCVSIYMTLHYAALEGVSYLTHILCKKTAKRQVDQDPRWWLKRPPSKPKPIEWAAATIE